MKLSMRANIDLLSLSNTTNSLNIWSNHKETGHTILLLKNIKVLPEHFLGYLAGECSLGSCSVSVVPVNWTEALSHEKTWRVLQIWKGCKLHNATYTAVQTRQNTNTEKRSSCKAWWRTVDEWVKQRIWGQWFLDFWAMILWWCMQAIIYLSKPNHVHLCKIGTYGVTATYESMVTPATNAPLCCRMLTLGQRTQDTLLPLTFATLKTNKSVL